MSRGYGISIDGLSVTRSGKRLFSNFHLQVEPSVVTVLLAPSGRGKTTLLDWIDGILPGNDTVVSGQCAFTVSEKNSGEVRISYLFQEPRLIPGCTILSNVSLPLDNIMDKSSSQQRAMYFLERTGLENRRNSYPDSLSGGEKQRAALARAFAYPSDILLMDEAFQSQDIKTKIHLMELFLSMNAEERRTVIFVTHDIQEAVCLADRILVMDGSPLQILLDVRTDTEINERKNVRNFFIEKPERLVVLEKKITLLLTK